MVRLETSSVLEKCFSIKGILDHSFRRPNFTVMVFLIPPVMPGLTGCLFAAPQFVVLEDRS
jgi:hypothetical protein